MLDPLSALSAAGTVIQFVDFSCKIFSCMHEIQESISGSTSVNRELEQITTDLSDELVKLSRSHSVDGVSGCLTEDEARLETLCRDCSHVGTELLRKLHKLKRKGKKKAWESLSKAIQAAWSKNEIDALVQRLRNFKDAIELHIMVGLRQSMDLNALKESERFDKLEIRTQYILTALFEQRVSISEMSRQMLTMADLLSRTQVVITELRKESQNGHVHIIDAFSAIRNDCIPFATVYPDRALKRLDAVRTREETIIKHAESKILELLWFITKDDRKETVALAHQRTFRWIFEDSAPSSKPWDSFVQWLRDKGKTYWIAGKPGSGKSTLMKFIHRDPRTLTELQKWAGGTPLLTSSFFFWNSGTKEQRSQVGFLKALLYDLLQQEPALISVCFPTLWAQIYSCESDPCHGSSNDFGDSSPPPQLSLEKLIEAFNRLLEQDVLPVKICLFIDGLDEFEGDKIELVKLIARCSASSTVKICASSRPLIVFEDHFQTSPQLLLQDLSAVDIKTYVISTLNDNPRFEYLARSEAVAATNLINEVVNVADGVFLWVRLATKSLLDGMSNHDNIWDLRKRLKQIPTELVGLYEHMLTGIDPFYQVESSKIFQIVHAAEHRYIFNGIDDFPLTPWELSWAMEDCESKLVKEVGDKANQLVERDEADIRSINATSWPDIIVDHVKSRCGGLLEINQEGADEEKGGGSKDDASGSHATSDRSIILPNLQYIHWTAREYLESEIVLERHRQYVRGTLFNPNISYLKACVVSLSTQKWDWGSRLWHRIFTIMWHAYEADSANNTFYIDMVDDMDISVTKSFALHYYGADTEAHEAVERLKDHWTLYEPARSLEKTFRFEKGSNSKPDFLGFAVQFGLSLYIKKKLGRGKYKLKKRLGLPLLAYAVFPYAADQRYKVSPEVVAVLFQCGADPNENYDGHSCWQMLLENTAGLPKPTDREVILKWITIFELFLQYGAYPYQRVDIDGEKRTALAIVTDTFMEWAPLDVSNLHQMLVARGASLESTLIQRQSDLVGVATGVAATYGYDTILRGTEMAQMGTEALGNYLNVAERKLVWVHRKFIRRGWRRGRSVMLSMRLELGKYDQSKDESKDEGNDEGKDEGNDEGKDEDNDKGKDQGKYKGKDLAKINVA